MSLRSHGPWRALWCTVVLLRALGFFSTRQPNTPPPAHTGCKSNKTIASSYSDVARPPLSLLPIYNPLSAGRRRDAGCLKRQHRFKLFRSFCTQHRTLKRSERPLRVAFGTFTFPILTTPLCSPHDRHQDSESRTMVTAGRPPSCMNDDANGTTAVSMVLSQDADEPNRVRFARLCRRLRRCNCRIQ